MLQQHLRVAQRSNPVVGDAMEKQDPVAIRPRGPDFPAAQGRAIGRAYREIGTRCANVGEGLVGTRDRICIFADR